MSYGSANLESSYLSSPELQEMQRAILGSLSTPIVRQVEAYFDSSDSHPIDRMIGRDAHL